MALSFTKKSILSGFQSTDALEENFDNLETATADGLSRSGTGPNAMGTDLDMNSQRILNLPVATTAGEPVTFGQITTSNLQLQGFLSERLTAGSGFTAGAALVTLSTATYTLGLLNLHVYINGVFQAPSQYTENTTTTFTMNANLTINDVVDVWVLSIATASTTTPANLITYTPKGGSIVYNVDEYLDDTLGLTDAGDAGVTLTAFTSDIVLRYNAAITVDRAVTLSTTDAVAGWKFTIIRSSLSTGAFNVNVGTGPLKVLRTGEWCSVVYDGTAWVLSEFGFLSPAVSGTSTLVNGTTSIAVTHGAGFTPVSHEINIHLIETLASASYWWIDTLTATQFTINVNIDPTQDVDFAWSIRRNG